MITLRYTGDKEHITPGGVFFFKGKADKYVYLPSAFKIYVLIFDPKNWHGKHLEYAYPTDMPHDAEMVERILADDPKLIARAEEQIERYNRELDEEIEEVRNSHHLEKRERDALIGNLKAMRSYRVQRTANKILYHALIDRIVQVIHNKEINRLEVPPTRNNYHVLESLRSGLVGQKVSNKVSVEYENKQGRPVLVLYPYGKPSLSEA